MAGTIQLGVRSSWANLLMESINLKLQSAKAESAESNEKDMAKCSLAGN